MDKTKTNGYCMFTFTVDIKTTWKLPTWNNILFFKCIYYLM